ncbi:MAG: PAS domain-containing protein, partial [Methyloglobulus sp.]
MNVIEQKFQDEIEVERLWLASEHGSFTFFSMLPVAVLIVVGFWDAASHIGLIVWFVVNRAINFARWMIFSYYHERREKLTVGINKFKNLVLSVSILHGLSWAVFVFWFLSPFDPTKFLLVSLALIIEIMGALLFWYSFLPALIAITLPITVALVSVLILQDSQICLIAAVIVFIACLLGFISSIKLSEVLKYSLFLYFENAALRKESEEKSLLLETALENMGQAISMTDNHDRLRMWNRQFIKFLGEAGDKVGTDVQLDGIWQMTQPPVFIGANDRAEYRTQDGLTYEIRQSALKLGGRVLTYTDISDLIKREEALEKARKEAEQANVA